MTNRTNNPGSVTPAAYDPADQRYKRARHFVVSGKVDCIVIDGLKLIEGLDYTVTFYPEDDYTEVTVFEEALR